MENEGKRMSSSQSERTLGKGKGVVENKQGRTRGEGSKLGNLERTYLLNVPQLHL